MGVTPGVHPLKSPQSDTCLAWGASKAKATLTVRGALGIGACLATGTLSVVTDGGGGVEGFGVNVAGDEGGFGVAAAAGALVVRSPGISGL